MPKSDRIRHVKKRAFLAAFAQLGNVSAAVRTARIHRDTHYAWLRSDPDYADAFGEAHEEACDRLEAEARRRGVSGWDEPVFYHGVQCGSMRRYSDTLLICLLRANMPEKYRYTSPARHSGFAAQNVVDVAEVLRSFDGSKGSPDQAPDVCSRV